MDAGLNRLAFQPEVEQPSLGPQSIKLLFQRGTPGPVPQRQRCQAMVGQHDQLPSLVTADMLGHHQAVVQDADFMTVSADCDWLARALRRCRVTIAVEFDPQVRADDCRHDFVGVEGDYR